MKDSRIRNFRNFVKLSTEQGRVIDHNILQRIVSDMTASKRRFSTFGSRLNVAVAATGVMIGWWDSSLITAILAATAGVVGQEIIGRSADKAFSKNANWLLPFVEVKHNVRRDAPK